MKQKLFLFDFDGTIADSFPHVKNIINNLAKKHNFSQLTDAEIEMLRTKGPKEIIKYAKVSWWRMPFIARDFKKAANEIIKEIKVFKGIKETIVQLNNEGHCIVILTSNSRKNVEVFLENHQMEKYVKEILSDVGLFGKTKAIKNAIKEMHAMNEYTYYIGDEVRDIEAAKKANVKTVAVTWGFNTKESLIKTNPDFLISNPNQLLKI